MAATLGDIEGRLLIAVGVAEPVELGTFAIPVHVTADGPRASVSIPEGAVKQALHDLALEMADKLA
jgi:hypothetical protein